MERLWAPWRLEYIKNTLYETEGCFLCEAAAAGVNRERLVLAVEGPILVLMNLYPYNNGHLMVAPTRHVGELRDLTDEETAALFKGVQRASLWLDEAYAPHGYNIGMNLGRVAGAGTPGHLHIHIVPRWNGDTNFMPVVGEAKVMSEALEAGWERIRAAMSDQASGKVRK